MVYWLYIDCACVKLTSFGYENNLNRRVHAVDWLDGVM